MKLVDMIKSISNPPLENEFEALRKYLKDNPGEVNQADESGKTPCHYAVLNFRLLVFLVLVGKALLPEYTTTDMTLNKLNAELRKEQLRIKASRGFFHLHDMMRRAVPIANIRLRCRHHDEEVNQTSYWGRTPCHWAAMQYELDYLALAAKLKGSFTARDWAALHERNYLALFAELNGDLTARDMDGKTPLDLITHSEAKISILKHLASLKAAALAVEQPEERDSDEAKSNPKSEGVYTRVKSKITSSMRQAFSPLRRENSHSEKSQASEPISSRRNPTSHDYHPRAKSPPLSPRSQAKSKQPLAVKPRSILKFHLPAELTAVADPISPGAIPAVGPNRNNTDLTRGSHTQFLPMPSLNPVTARDTVPLATTIIEVSPANSVTITDIANPLPASTENLITLLPLKKLRFEDDGHYQESNPPIIASDAKSPQKIVPEAKAPLAINDYPRDIFHNPVTSCKPETPVPFLKYAGTLVSIFKRDNLEQFQEYYAQRKVGANHKLSGFGRPLLIQALLANAGLIFIFLLKQGANLDVRTHSGKSFIDYISTKQRIEFLKQVHESLVTIVSTSRIQSDQDILRQLEKNFQQMLSENGLTSPFKRKNKDLEKSELDKICEKHPQSKDLVRALYDLSIGMDDPKKDKDNAENEGKFDPAAIQNYVVGLLAVTTPQSMMIILKDLYPLLQPEQKLMVIFIIKEMIILDRFHHCYSDMQFCNETLPAFIQEIKPKSPDRLLTFFQQMITLQKKINHPFVRAINQLEIVISRCDSTQPTAPIDDCKILVREMQTITSQFLLTVNITEFVNQAWTKKNRLELAATVVDQQSLYNKMTNYFAVAILQQPSEEKCHAYIKLCIRTIELLIKGEPCDLNSAMIISGALNHRFIKQYVQEFLQQNSDVKKIWDKTQQVLDITNNFQSMRDIMKDSTRFSYPLLAIYLKDLTQGDENTDLKSKATVLGSTLRKLMLLQDTLRSRPAPHPQSNLSFLVHTQKEITEHDIELMKMKKIITPLRFNSDTTLPHLIKLIECYIEEKCILKVAYGLEIKVGLAAIEFTFDWIKQEINPININPKDIDTLSEKLGKLPNASDERIEYHSKQLLKWLSRQSAVKPALSQFNSLPKTNIISREPEEDKQKGKEHAPAP